MWQAYIISSSLTDVATTGPSTRQETGMHAHELLGSNFDEQAWPADSSSNRLANLNLFGRRGGHEDVSCNRYGKLSCKFLRDDNSC